MTIFGGEEEVAQAAGEEGEAVGVGATGALVVVVEAETHNL